MSDSILDAVVIGAGQAGLAAGYYLQRAGLRFVIFEAGLSVSGSWSNYYDSLKLFSPVRYSSLPGLPFPGDPDSYPCREDVISYLGRYASHFHLPVTVGVPVNAVQRDGERFQVRTAQGAVHSARTIIAATGSFRDALLPDIPGQADFQGRTLHSADYRNPEPFAGQRVVVVGGGMSGVQIAVELAQVAQVALAVRKPVRIIPQQILGRDVHFWLRFFGLDQSRLLRHRKPPFVIDTGDYRQALKDCRPKEQAPFLRFTRTGVVWPDETEEAVDTVIFATGYRPRFPYLTGLGVPDAEGQVRQRSGVSTSVPGLYFVGLAGQRVFSSATLRGVGPDAARVVRHLQRSLCPSWWTILARWISPPNLEGLGERSTQHHSRT